MAPWVPIQFHGSNHSGSLQIRRPQTVGHHCINPSCLLTWPMVFRRLSVSTTRGSWTAPVACYADRHAACITASGYALAGMRSVPSMGFRMVWSGWRRPTQTICFGLHPSLQIPHGHCPRRRPTAVASGRYFQDPAINALRVLDLAMAPGRQSSAYVLCAVVGQWCNSGPPAPSSFSMRARLVRCLGRCKQHLRPKLTPS